MSTSVKAFILARLAIGTSLFGHGLVRLPKLDKFSHGMAAEFQHSILPQDLVLGFGYVLPFAEFIIGLLIILGLFTRHALTAGAIVMILLIFGTTTIERFDALPAQLIHTLFLVGLLAFVDKHNAFALDSRLNRRRSLIHGPHRLP
jgi:thiosulfate dehydrogenase (quinone) large subunit